MVVLVCDPLATVSIVGFDGSICAECDDDSVYWAGTESHDIKVSSAAADA
jgi:hypothetical protein